ncbi:MAG: hypothetical protein PHW10_02730 [Candidatus Peribacteraceae bacterium]|nr:hypothetical protein [Candidatus Peribacteraceae bacterium]
MPEIEHHLREQASCINAKDIHGRLQHWGPLEVSWDLAKDAFRHVLSLPGNEAHLPRLVEGRKHLWLELVMREQPFILDYFFSGSLDECDPDLRRHEYDHGVATEKTRSAECEVRGVDCDHLPTMLGQFARDVLVETWHASHLLRREPFDDEAAEEGLLRFEETHAIGKRLRLHPQVVRNESLPARIVGHDLCNLANVLKGYLQVPEEIPHALPGIRAALTGTRAAAATLGFLSADGPREHWSIRIPADEARAFFGRNRAGTEDVAIDPRIAMLRSEYVTLLSQFQKNARLHAPRLSTTIRPEKEDLLLRVEDDGPGLCLQDGTPFTPEMIPVLFRTDFSTKKENGGFGLQLVNAIVEARKGAIAVCSIPADGKPRSWSSDPSFTLPVHDHAGTVMAVRMPY